ncbi:SusC/RagA family TonB-linked outer membrane protein [Chitinophaga japonensis]|uniref:TonB-linked SusC/RagA family outer membrane protein n=1 Tax=Chitinophaga japonensis TaxID=104662 RepID=A0A562STD6_CHIJA|nr:TonB-dependent receptor [Chitinophaga japonensis]TWI84472.1 TonB-linked SusC/RagA family outer membrane protein [Chitinophaga japonensis]
MMQQSYKALKGHAMPFIPAFLFALLLSLSLQAQERKTMIRGLVENENGQALEGVSVDLRNESTGAKRSALTNKAGVFMIETPGATGPYMFRISHLGYVTQTLHKESLDPQKEEALYVVLKASSTSLDEVVVSYGRQQRRDVTGAIVQLDAAGVRDMPVNQFAQQLQGKIAGVQVGQNNGQPGRGMEFRIRGAASLSSGNQPLFVIDGIPVTGSINNINPAEIETFTVLKDASASSLYGSRAANGVVLITTRHARPGDPKIEFNTFYGVQVIPQQGRPRMMTAREFAEFQNEYYEDRVKYEGYTGELAEEYRNPERYGEGTNWFNALTRAAPVQNYDLTFSSATERSSSAVIVGYQDQQGVILNTGTKLFTLRLNQDFNFSDNKLKIGFGLAPSYRIDHNNRLGTQGVNGLMEKIVEASPLIAPVDENGDMPLYVNSPGMVANVNPYAQFTQRKDDYKTTRLLGNTYLHYNFLDGLTLKTNLAVDKGAETRNYFSPASISTAGVATGLSSSVDNYSWTAEATLNYVKTFARDHYVEALAGYSVQKFEQESNTVSGTNFPGDDVEWLSAATSITDGSSNTTAYSLLSAIARLNYSFKDRYLLSVAVRRDGSSRFGSARKYGNFPSVSAGWIISSEKFMEKLPFVDFLKIRASYGITGNNNIGNYPSIPGIAPSNYVFNGELVPGLAISRLGNSELAWERNKQLDIGFELAVLDNRLSFTYDYYHKISDGLIQDRPIPRASGFTTITSNVGEIELWGHELALNANIIDRKLKWDASFNISFDRNKIKALVAPGFFRRNNTVSSDYYRNQVGHALGEFYGFVFEGLYKDEEDLKNSARWGDNSDVGTIKMRDVVPDGVIDNNDRTFIGDPNPDFLYGFTNNLRYKRFDFSISVAGSVGGQILNPSKWAYLTNLDGARMLLAAVKDRWRSPEDPGSGIYPRTKTGTTAIGRYVNSQWLEDGSYLSAKNITLGYTIPLGSNLLLRGLRVYGSVQHAFIITGYSGINPEISLDGLNGTSIGIDENAYPVPRTFALGLTATFK